MPARITAATRPKISSHFRVLRTRDLTVPPPAPPLAALAPSPSPFCPFFWLLVVPEPDPLAFFFGAGLLRLPLTTHSFGLPRGCLNCELGLLRKVTGCPRRVRIRCLWAGH